MVSYGIAKARAKANRADWNARTEITKAIITWADSEWEYELEIENGKLTGNYVGEIVNGRRKAELLKLIAQVENVNIAQTIAVGDGANDLTMLSTAGLGIAFHAKPKVKQNAGQSISTIGIDGVLHFLGFKDSYLSDGNSNTL